MLKAILGRKIGMTQIFSENGSAIPVTVIEAGPCTVTQIKTVATDGYEAIQIGFGAKTAKHTTRPEMGHLGHTLPPLEAQKKRRQEERARTRQAARARGQSGVAAEEAEETTEGEEESTTSTSSARSNERRRGRAGGGLGPFQVLREVEADGDGEVTIGQVIGTDIFGVGDFVDIIGTSKGKGFQGVMKRHGFKGGQRTHGQSDRLRAPGSIGAGTTPGRVFKGTRMAGRMGNDRITVKALEIIQADAERNLLVVKGSIPGANGGIVMIRKPKARI